MGKDRAAAAPRALCITPLLLWKESSSKQILFPVLCPLFVLPSQSSKERVQVSHHFLPDIYLHRAETPHRGEVFSSLEWLFYILFYFFTWASLVSWQAKATEKLGFCWGWPNHSRSCKWQSGTPELQWGSLSFSLCWHCFAWPHSESSQHSVWSWMKGKSKPIKEC